MNMKTSPLAFIAHDAVPNGPLPTGLLPLLAEYTEMRKLSCLSDEEGPADQRYYEIEDVVCGMRPTSLPEATALLRWAFARHPNTLPNSYGGISSDDILRGVDPTDVQAHGFDFCERSIWYVVQFLHGMLGGDPLAQRTAWLAALAKHERAKGLHEKAAQRCAKAEQAMFADRENEAKCIAAERAQEASDRALERADLALDAVFELPAPDLAAVSLKLTLLERDECAALEERMKCIRADLARLSGKAACDA